MRSRPAWFTLGVSGQPGLHQETLSSTKQTEMQRGEEGPGLLTLVSLANGDQESKGKQMENHTRRFAVTYSRVCSCSHVAQDTYRDLWWLLSLRAIGILIGLEVGTPALPLSRPAKPCRTHRQVAAQPRESWLTRSRDTQNPSATSGALEFLHQATNLCGKATELRAGEAAQMIEFLSSTHRPWA